MTCSARMSNAIGVVFALLLVAINGGLMMGGVAACDQHATRKLQQQESTAVLVEVLGELKRSITSDPLRILNSWEVLGSSSSNVTLDPCKDKWRCLTCDGEGELIGLDLSNQQLTGTLTPSLTLLSLTSLSSLDLSQNNLNLSSDVADLSHLIPPNLRLLNLSYTIIGANRQLSHLLNLSTTASARLQQLCLDGIQLTGSLPQQLTAIQLPRTFPSLSTLSLSHNSLTGALSAVAQQLLPCQSLQHLDLSHNNLSGTLDNWCGGGSNLLATLTYLDVSFNTLQGLIPAGIANCSALQHLDLAYNGLWGTIPASLPLSCPNLTFFSVLYCHSLSGSLPPEFSLLSRLDSLFLEGNNFSGAPLPILLNCSALRTIHLFGNFFQGRIPSDFCTRLPNLQDLVLGTNSFSGPLPPSLANCSFTNLMLGFNEFSGSISGEMLGKWTELQRQLDLQHNSFTGSIPSQIGNLTKLEILILNNNHFSGSFPQEMGLLSSLEGATFEYNSFSGNFPGQMFNCTQLQHLIIHHNSLGGPIPSSIGQALKLSYLEAENNLLSGSLPDALANCTQLQNFSLGHNQLTGSIPEYLASTPNILFLFDLSHNNFSGAIPTGFGGMLQMQSLDLSHNKLSGPIPGDLSFCVGLLSLNLASNALEGSIPSSLGNSSLALAVLNLSFNSLSGSIPPTLGGLRSLQRLDLSYNELEGVIPATLSTAPSLVFLNFSYNNLQGVVPERGSGVFHNATAASFLGNPGLCGEIVLRSCSHRQRSVLAGKAAKIGLIVGAALFVLLVVALIAWRTRTQVQRTSPSSLKSNFTKLRLRQIQEATNNFSMEQLIGTGASGSVYKGVMADGEVLAFKRFTMESSSLHAFFRELEAVRQIRHRNLIKILGYWSNQKDNNILILEYMKNGSLEDHLHQLPMKSRSCKLTWEMRKDIAMEVAEGLLYLHEDCAKAPIIHCDIKPSNILFDANMQVHISDFGLAKIVVDMVTSTQNLRGTLGYMAPECASFGQISPKCDVYSFGILMLELASGIRPTDHIVLKEDMTLVEWAKSKIRVGLFHEVLDETMVSTYDEGLHNAQMELLINVALECTRENSTARPTMSQVLTRLRGPINIEDICKGSLLYSKDELL